MDYIFSILDYAGKPVMLGERQWKQKIISSTPVGHPEVAGYLAEIQMTIYDPDIVFESSVRSDTHLLCLLDVGREKYRGKHLIVIVKYVKEKEVLRGYVTTAYLTRALAAKRRVLWKKQDQLTS